LSKRCETESADNNQQIKQTYNSPLHKAILSIKDSS
jgi:hypothetical protein